MTNKKNTRRNFLILLGLTIANFFIPDPIPVIDELILTGWTAVLGFQLIN